MITAAIVGLGRWGRNLVNAVQAKSDKIRFSRCVVRRPDAVHELARQHDLEISEDLPRVLADPRVDAIVLATPHTLHAEQIIAAAVAGKAVFSEKPLALNTDDAKRAIEACRRAGVVLGVGHDKRFYPSMRELKRVVESGELGEILHIEGHFSNESSRKFYAGWRESPEESPGGNLTAMGIHLIDAFVDLAGPARRASTQLVTRAPDPSPVDTISVFFELSNQVSGVLCSVRTTPQYWRLHVFGKNGSAETIGATDFVLRMWDARPVSWNFEPVDSLRLELEAFADAAAGRVPYPITPQQILDGVAALEAAIKSSEVNEPVAVSASVNK